ncbi:hypothetical protein L7F22_066454 [Adiantum nelumboides]|nr:hypothetical protein [Adiantum nelumboides]
MEDSERVTKRTFLEWVARPKDGLSPMELLREFERRYAQFSTIEQVTLDAKKVELFLQATGSEIQEKLELLLEDESIEQGLKSEWKDVEDAVSLLAKRQCRRDKMVINNATPTSITTENEAKSPSTTSQKNDESSMLDELVKGPSKRAIRSGGRKDPGPSQEPAPQVPPPPEVPMEETSIGKKKDTRKAKGKSPTYKLQSDIEVATDLKKVLEERILNSKVEFTLGEVLGIAKREFHDEIIDIIKQKRQALTESIHSQGEEGSSKTHVIQLPNKKGNENVAGCYQSSRRGKQVSFADDEEDDETTYKSHYSRTHWARATTETLVKVGNIEEPYVALIDHGSEINLMSMNLYAKGIDPGLHESLEIDFILEYWLLRLHHNISTWYLHSPRRGSLFSAELSMEHSPGADGFGAEVGNNRPSVLITNDDGIHAPGLLALVCALVDSGICRIFVCAPDQDKSGAGHSLTVHEALVARPIKIKGAIAYAVSGTPADCVSLSLSGALFPLVKPSLVLSGINKGCNCGYHM